MKLGDLNEFIIWRKLTFQYFNNIPFTLLESDFTKGTNKQYNLKIKKYKIFHKIAKRIYIKFSSNICGRLLAKIFLQKVFCRFAPIFSSKKYFMEIFNLDAR